jgi:ABC-type xylose transport system substrate-binding protein
MGEFSAVVTGWSVPVLTAGMHITSATAIRLGMDEEQLERWRDEDEGKSQSLKKRRRSVDWKS